MKEEIAKARERGKIYEHENQDQEMVFKIEEHKQDNITYYQQSTKHRSINIVTQQTLEYRTFTAALLEEIMTKNLRKLTYGVYLDKHHEQFQLKLQLQMQRKQLKIAKWGRYFIS